MSSSIITEIVFFLLAKVASGDRKSTTQNWISTSLWLAQAAVSVEPCISLTAWTYIDCTAAGPNIEVIMFQINSDLDKHSFNV